MPFDPDARLAEWRKSLLDTTKRNRLIKFVTGRVGGVNLVHPTTPELWDRLVRAGETLVFPWKCSLLGLPAERFDADTLMADIDPAGGDPTTAADLDREFTELCLRSPRLLPTHLLTDFADRPLVARLTRLFRTSQESERDHGVTTLFAAFGFLRWYESTDSTEELLSPLLLVPVRLTRENVEAPFTLTAEDDDILPNHCLAELLQTQCRIRLPTSTECPLDPENPECLAGYLRAVGEKVSHFRRWEILTTSALGVFNFQKLAMWHDLGRNAERVKRHPLCRAIAGDNSMSLKPAAALPSAPELDRDVPPAAALHILDADSSQHEAIEAVKRGAHLVMDGPPGTGKSQTIANMIAETLAAGKTVLFVSEKTAALEVVKRRLDKCGLGDFCLELHSHKANKRQVIAELGRCLDLKPNGMPDAEARLSELATVRQSLNDFVAELHAIRPPLGWSVFRVHGELACLDRLPGRSRLAIPDVATKDAEFVRRGAEILTALGDCHAVIDEPGGHPWRGCKLTHFSHAAADEAKFHLTRLANAVPAAEIATAALAKLGVGELPFTNRAWGAAVAESRRILASPVFPDEWFRGDPNRSAAAIVELDRVTREARDLVSKLPEFDQSAVRRVADSVRMSLAPDRERLTGGEKLSARERLARLGSVKDCLHKLGEHATVAQRIAQDIAGVFRLPVLPPFIQLWELARVSGRVSRTPPLPLSWWEPGRRAELLAAVTRAAQDDLRAQELRTQLVVKLSPSALAPETAPLAREAATAAASFWRWLPWSGWAKVRKQVEAWYPAAPPDGAAVRADVAALAEYHRRTEAVRQVATAYAGDLFTASAEKPDWDTTSSGLSDAQRLIDWKASPELRTVAGPGGSLDRENLRKLADELNRACTAFHQEWTELLKQCAIPEPTTLLNWSPEQLLAWLRAEAVAIEKDAGSLGQAVALLLPGRDLPANELRAKLSLLTNLMHLRALARDAAGVLGDSRSPETLEATDHTSTAEVARSLIALLAERACPVSPTLAATLSGPVARERLRAALIQSEAARPEFDKAWDAVTTDLFDPASTVSVGVVLLDAPLAALGEWAKARAADTDRIGEWVKFVETEKAAAAFGIAPLIDEVKAGEFPAASAADAFRARFYRLWLDSLHATVPALATFSSENQDRRIARFAELDRLAIRVTPTMVGERLITIPTRPRTHANPPEASELGILQREVNKKQRHLSLRTLFQQIPTILPRLKPCLMMSPLAVSTYLDNPETTFDLVIFDEASQVRPHDAVCAIYRGRQLVVGGDPKQLPPTDFFNRGSEDPDEAEPESTAAAGFESLLDVCLALGLTRKRLRWHYRSRREGLIAFSNHFFYDGRLVTFPSADDATTPAVGFVRVPEGQFRDGVNPVEARRVAELVMEHARTNPERSLGVIAFSQRQQDRILDELEVRRRQHPDTEAFFADDRDDPFFVKNLENVQGDERDAILLSVGYGPDNTGKVAMRFGPLNRSGGERRLNVAITRARRAMTVVSSMNASDIDLSRTGAEGAKLLKAFLDYAERGPAALAEAVTEADRRGADSPFEQEVGEELVRRGLTIHRQVGCGGYRIDLAITDPQLGGKYLLGVECDGATYHSAATARDRDRLRQAVLEGLGWRLVRVWSSDWIRDREKQVRRILAALESARNPRPQPDPEPEKLTVVKWKPVRAKPEEFESIETVPAAALTDAIAGVLTEFGSMPAEDLVAAVSKRLGFKRTGPKIRERIAEAVNAQVSASVLGVTEEGRIRMVNT